MKKTLVFFFIALTSSVFSENTIIAIINNYPITLNSVQTKLEKANSKNEKLIILNNYIDNTLQFQKAIELNLTPNKKDIENILLEISKNNNLSSKEMRNLENFPSIENEVLERLTILNLQRFVTKDLKITNEKIFDKCLNNNNNFDTNQKQIKIAQIIISDIDIQANDMDKKNSLIKTFLNKLADHINKGASFEAFAKLHSQHPSYQNGGITDWLPVKGPTLKMLDSLNKKEVSEVYTSDFGFAIAIKIDERFISSKLKECKEVVIYENAEMYYSDWLTNLREEANIEIYYDKLL